MVTALVSARVRGKLETAGARVLEVPSIAIPSDSSQAEAQAVHGPTAETHVASWVETGYTKLNLWALGTPEFGSWDRVVYVDADAVVLEPLDPIFERLGPDTPLVAAPDVFPPDRFNAGVLGVRLDREGAIVDDLKRRVGQLGTYDGGDTGKVAACDLLWFPVLYQNELDRSCYRCHTSLQPCCSLFVSRFFERIFF